MRKLAKKIKLSDARRVIAVYGDSHAAMTNAAYLGDLRQFAKFMRAGSPQAAVAKLLEGGKGFAYEKINAYKAQLRRTVSAATVNRRMSTIRALLKQARELELIDWTVTVPNLKTQAYRDTRGPGRDAYARMLDFAVNQGGPKAYRDAAILRLFYDLALRRSEVTELDANRIDLARPAISVLAKGRTQREWYALPLETQEALAAWLAVRGDWDGPMFTSFNHSTKGKQARLSGMGVYWLVKNIGQMVGCKATPHGLRHSAITDALLMGNSPADVQKFSRHKNLNTLQIYYDQAQAVATDIASDLARGAKRAG